MIALSDDDFNNLIATAIDELPDEYTKHLDNLLITYEDNPSPAQREKLNLRCDQTLFGLYEGIPLVARGGSYSGVTPDRITIFKHPILFSSKDLAQVKTKVKHTLWHEFAHYFGLNHDRIHEIEASWQ